MTPSVARFDSHFSVRSTAYALATVLKEIREGQTTVITADAIASQIGGRSLRHACDYAQSLLQNGNRDGYDVVKTSLPAVAFQGVSCEHSRAIDDLSGLVICEWDDVEDPAYALSILSQHPYVRAAWISLGGNGVKAIGVATPTPSADNYHLAWFTFSNFFEDIGAVDTAGRRVNQLNALAYADRFYENVNALSFEWDAEDTAEYAAQFPDAVAEDIENAARVSLPVEYQDAILEMEWKDDGWGRTRLPCLFQQHEHDAWGSRSNAMAVRRGATGDFLVQCHKCSQRRVYREKENGRRNASLTITGDAQETLATLRDNDNALTEAFTNALTETDADTPHYHIVHFEMGSGKNHSLLTSLATLKKRGIGIFENHEQVDEQVLKASLMGLSSAKLRGRGYKFDDSNLRLTDIVSRRLNDALFDENPNVMCAFYDVIEKREEKGLAPYPYCLNCPFYENQSCPYINQFIGVSEKDFIAACMHDLFFDPNFRHILAGLWRTPEDSEEEAVIGDALGLAPKEASSFDIGILDEVVARNLYLDDTYSFQDMHELADAWEGEPLADFMKRLLDCLNEKTDAPLETVQTHIESLSENVQMLIASQMTQIPEDVDVQEQTLRDRVSTEAVLSEAYIEEASGIQRRIPVSQAAEAILREKEVPVRPYRKIAPKTKIGVSPYRGNGVSPDEVKGRLWAGGWTLLHQLQKAIQMDIAWIGTKYNVNGEHVCCDTFTITVPPQVSHIAKLLVLMGGIMDVENIITAFEGQDVNFTTSNGIPARYAKGVKTYQLTDRRLTYRSVFEVETDAEGKTVFDAETKKPLVIGLTAPAETELEKLCMLAEKHIAEGHLKPVFISYKDFTETPISETPIVQRMHRCLQVKHFDLTRGLNFDGVKVFIVYGLPKSARPDVVKQTAEILYHTELAQTPLDMTYQRGNEVREGYKAENIGVYADKRMEAVRQQLTRDKSKQALYRARPTRWQDTITLHFSAEPIPDWTERATGFVRTDLQTAERFEDIGGVIKARENAEQNGDVKALASATGQSERTTYRKTDTTRNQRKVDMQARAYQLYCEKCHNDTIIARLQSEYGKKVTDRTLRRWRKKAKF